MIVRKLAAADVPQLIALRREALEDAPAAFLASPGTDIGQDEEFVTRALADVENQFVLGAFEGEVLIGMSGVVRRTNPKTRHKATLWGMFVRATQRGDGVGGDLLSESIEQTRQLEGVEQIELAVVDTADGARRLYERHGFEAWGVATDALRVGNRSHALTHMRLKLTPLAE